MRFGLKKTSSTQTSVMLGCFLTIHHVASSHDVWMLSCFRFCKIVHWFFLWKNWPQLWLHQLRMWDPHCTTLQYKSNFFIPRLWPNNIFMDPEILMEICTIHPQVLLCSTLDKLGQFFISCLADTVCIHSCYSGFAIVCKKIWDKNKGK